MAQLTLRTVIMTPWFMKPYAACDRELHDKAAPPSNRPRAHAASDRTASHRRCGFAGIGPGCVLVADVAQRRPGLRRRLLARSVGEPGGGAADPGSRRSGRD